MRNIRAATLFAGVLASVCIGAGSGLASATPGAPPGAHWSPASSWSPAARWPLAARGPAAPSVVFTATYLQGVYCTSRSNCWAVGLHYTSNAIVNQLLHWNGRSWRHFPVPNPGGTSAGGTSELASVRCTTARDCWAVGFYDQGGAELNQMLHWNGRAWFATRTPEPAGTGKNSQNMLTDVTCISARNCVAVGSFRTLNSGSLNEVLHWSGRVWTRVRAPEPGSATKTSDHNLLSVRCPAPSRCLAVGSRTVGDAEHGFNQALAWAGKSWYSQPVPSPGSDAKEHEDTLNSLGCGSRSSCFAVGNVSFGVYRSLNQALHWNGRSWSRSFTPQPGGTGSLSANFLYWVNCLTDRNCWAVGTYGKSTRPDHSRNEALHWNGRHWITVYAPNPSTGKADVDVLLSIRCTDAANCWAVGGVEHGTAVTNEILHWNGAKWSIWT